MKDLFVNYEVALKVKQLGFDEPCLGWYAKDIVLRKVNGVFIGTPSSGSYKLGCWAPLYQQVIDWFKNKYNIFAAVEIKWINGYSYIIQEAYYKDYAKGYPDHFIDIETPVESEYMYDTYEKALTDCINEVLKIIENEKNSN